MLQFFQECTKYGETNWGKLKAKGSEEEKGGRRKRSTMILKLPLVSRSNNDDRQRGRQRKEGQDVRGGGMGRIKGEKGGAEGRGQR